MGKVAKIIRFDCLSHWVYYSILETKQKRLVPLGKTKRNIKVRMLTFLPFRSRCQKWKLPFDRTYNHFGEFLYWIEKKTILNAHLIQSVRSSNMAWTPELHDIRTVYGYVRLLIQTNTYFILVTSINLKPFMSPYKSPI